jgi:signal transduction histidine kinase
LQRVVEYGGYVNLVLFTVVGLVALRQWRLGRGRAGLWAALSFGTLALVVDVAPLLDETPDRPFETLLQKTLIAALVLFPYLLYRFTTAFEPPTRRLEQLLGLMTLVLLVWTFALPDIPAEGEPRSTGFLVYVGAFLFHWTALTLVVAFRLWRGARAAPSVARRRLQVLAGAAAAITVALLIAAPGPDESSALAVATTLLTTLSAIGFLVGLAPPPILRLAWRRPENERLQAAIASLMGAASEEQVAEQVAEPMARIVGARGVALLDPAGGVIGSHGASEEMLDRSADEGEEIVEIPTAFGRLVVWTSPFAPYFGGEELRLLRTLGALTGLALDRARLYAQEREARLALERADDLKSNFIALAAHELRTPVTSINGVVQTLYVRGDQLDDDQRALLGAMLRDQGRRLGTLVEQLLDLSRLDADAISIDPELMRVKERAEELVRSTAGERADDVRVDVPDDLEAAIDPSAFDRILSNLVANALRYGDPPVIVRAEQRDRHFRLAVEDRGPGVPAEFVPDLFERFTRSRRAQERGVGTGLGLAIARSYAHAHSGELVYEPATPTGARFEFVIPSGNGHDDVKAHRLRSYRPSYRPY